MGGTRRRASHGPSPDAPARHGGGGLPRPGSTGALHQLPEIGATALARVSAAARRSSDSLAVLEERLKVRLSGLADDFTSTAADLGAKLSGGGAASTGGVADARLRRRTSLRPSTSFSNLDFAWPAMLGGGAATPPPPTPQKGGRAKAARRLGGALTAAPRLVGRVTRRVAGHGASASSSTAAPRRLDVQEDVFAAIERTLGSGFEVRKGRACRRGWGGGGGGAHFFPCPPGLLVLCFAPSRKGGRPRQDPAAVTSCVLSECVRTRPG